MTTKKAAPAATATADAAPALTTEQIVAAFAAALLPLAGPAGVAASMLVPALEQMINAFRGAGAKDYSVEDLVAIVQTGNVELAQLQRDRAAQKADEDAAKPTGTKP